MMEGRLKSIEQRISSAASDRRLLARETLDHGGREQVAKRLFENAELQHRIAGERHQLLELIEPALRAKNPARRKREGSA